MVGKSLRVVPSGDGNATRRTLRILIADDDRDASLTLATILRTEGHEAHIVLRGDEVLELDRFIRSDVLILDINLPGASGYALARDIRERRGPAISPLLIAIPGNGPSLPKSCWGKRSVSITTWSSHTTRKRSCDC
jgi:PleD family two-component response regulator